MWREDVRLSFREDIQVVVILLGDLLIEGGVWGGKGVEGRGERWLQGWDGWWGEGRGRLWSKRGRQR